MRSYGPWRWWWYQIKCYHLISLKCLVRAHFNISDDVCSQGVWITTFFPCLEGGMTKWSLPGHNVCPRENVTLGDTTPSESKRLLDVWKKKLNPEGGRWPLIWISYMYRKVTDVRQHLINNLCSHSQWYLWAFVAQDIQFVFSKGGTSRNQKRTLLF